jgi:hypothetical protein
VTQWGPRIFAATTGARGKRSSTWTANPTERPCRSSPTSSGRPERSQRPGTLLHLPSCPVTHCCSSGGSSLASCSPQQGDPPAAQPPQQQAAPAPAGPAASSGGGCRRMLKEGPGGLLRSVCSAMSSRKLPGLPTCGSRAAQARGQRGLVAFPPPASPCRKGSAAAAAGLHVSKGRGAHRSKAAGRAPAVAAAGAGVRGPLLRCMGCGHGR